MAPEPLGGSMTILWLDIETRSKCDLLKRGVYNYAEHPSTEVLCICYAFDDGEVQTWRRGERLPIDLTQHKGQVRAHNAAFEWLLFAYVLDIHYDSSQWYCTATQARANCLPGSLEDVGRALGASMRKDHRGSQLIRALCIPQADGTFNEDPALMQEMLEYCAQDVRAMRAVSKAMRDLTADEQRDWYVNEQINERGILVDVELCKAAMSYANDEAEDITRIVREVTGGALTSVRSPRMREWVHERVGSEAKKMMIQHKDGEAKVSIDKATRANLLLLAEENSDEVPPDVADVIQCADDIWASSVAKFQRLKELACYDNRVRGAFVFAGGVATGRASSYGAQVHNFTRKCVKEPQRVRDSMVGGLDIVPHYGRRVTDVLKGMLRPSIHARPGYALIVADWAAIEARANPWLSNDLHAEEVLDVFRAGRDIYIREAAGIFRVTEAEVTSDQRQIGKVAILSCGYAGGVGAFAAMGRAYGVLMPEEDAKRTVNAWRRANSWAVRYWGDLENAYLLALRHKGREFSAGRVTYMFDGLHLWYALPSGRVLCYPFARLEEDGVSYLKAAWKPAADAKEWPRARLWRGLACENVCQATANDLLRYALRQCPDAVLHVHDEIVLEVPEAQATAAAQELVRVMCTAPAWAAGLPLKAEVKVMTRYGK